VSLPPVLLALQERLQHEFADPQLLVQALTHRSFSADHNERLEFLGDSVLNLAVAHLLYEGLSTLPEGDLSRVRANLVKQDTLHGLALSLGLAEALRLGEGEMRSGGQRRPSILADALEAVLGAVYLDAGYGWRRPWCDGCSTVWRSRPPCRRLRRIRRPACRSGCSFDVECEIAELGLSERGIGGSRRAGEQAAAAAVLEILKTRNPR
jgi:ribonuclease-3